MIYQRLYMIYFNIKEDDKSGRKVGFYKTERSTKKKKFIKGSIRLKSLSLNLEVKGCL